MSRRRGLAAAGGGPEPRPEGRGAAGRRGAAGLGGAQSPRTKLTELWVGVFPKKEEEIEEVPFGGTPDSSPPKKEMEEVLSGY